MLPLSEGPDLGNVPIIALWYCLRRGLWLNNKYIQSYVLKHFNRLTYYTKIHNIILKVNAINPEAQHGMYHQNICVILLINQASSVP